jgi:hypothetical protein
MEIIIIIMPDNLEPKNENGEPRKYVYQNDVIPRNKKGQRHGQWIKHFADGGFNFMESYINDRAHGYSKQFIYTKFTKEIDEKYYAR